MRFVLTIAVALAFAAPAEAQSVQSKTSLFNTLLQTIVACANGQQKCIHPQAVQALINSIIASSCTINSAADCPLPPGVASNNLGPGGVTPSLLATGAATANIGLDASLRADLAYQGFVSRFWIGTQTGGHFAIINTNNFGPAANPPVETAFQKGYLWQYAQAWTVPYVYWKVTADPDALARITAEWNWVKANWSSGDMAVCNNVGGQSATTLDDASWAVRGLVELADATGDNTALTYAKAMIDCFNGSAGFYDYALGTGLTHWYDATPISSASWSAGVVTLTLSRTPAVGVNPPDGTRPNGYSFNVSGFSNTALNGTWKAAASSGTTITFALASNPGAISGGGWYHSGQGKGMDSLSFALAELSYFQAACVVEGGACPSATAYFNAAKVEMDWANSTLDRSANSNCAQTDHLYWASVGYGTPPVPMDTYGSLCPSASNISLSSSVVSLAENMGAAVANAMIYAKTATTSYQAQAQNIAASILAKEIDTCGALLDDRDARVGGFASYDFSTKVMPILSSSAAASLKSAYLSVSLATAQRNKSVTGAFSGDWCGPWNGVWTKHGFHPDQLEISAQAPIIAITAAGL